MRFLMTTLGAALLALAWSNQASAETYTGTGTATDGGSSTVSAKAVFSVSGGTLTIVLTNISSSATPRPGATLTGIGFSITGSSPALDLSTTALTSGSKIWTSSTSSNVTDALAGSWTDKVDSSPPSGIKYGVATTGANGNFNGNGIELGGSDPDYGIAAAGSFPGGFGGSPNQYPYIQDSLTFTFSGATGLDLSKLTNVQFFFGTNGDYFAGKPDAVPEPSTLAIAGLGALGLIGYGLRRRRVR